jgi:hypothetical protein
MFMLSFSRSQKAYSKRSIILDQDFSGRMIVKKESIGLPNEVWCVNPRIRVALEFRTWKFSKWLFKLINEDGMWQTILRNKYLTNQTIGKVDTKSGDSQFWAGLMKAKETVLRHGSFHLNNGKQIRFWEDRWLGNQSFQHQYPSLYTLVRRKSATVESVLSMVPLNVSFRRFLNYNNRVLWNELVGRIMHVQLNDQNDVFSWNLHQHGQYNVHSLYLALINNGLANMNKQLWRLKVPLKIKIFMWYMRKGLVLTKDNLAKRNWGGSKQCSFCCKDRWTKRGGVNWAFFKI